MWHNVDFTDPYSHTFKNLSPMNFPRHGSKFWDAASNDILYMNRLRHIDYVKAFEAVQSVPVRAVSGLATDDVISACSVGIQSH